ncbi:MAG: hypothetical protein M3Y05_04570, partial [Gemmatimonadota bacterium]|nr:hypothetical protein [Gemmatimonadota bacterium]
MRALPAFAAVMLVMPLAAQQPTDTSVKAPAPAALVPMIVQPSPDQARGFDAELRMALFDVSTDHPLSALDRLEWLRSSPLAGSGAATPGLRAQEDLLFLLAESYYRLGMRDAFRKTA